MSTTYYTPFRFAGHGINDRHGVRMATFDEPAKRQARDGLGDMMAAAPEMYEALKTCLEQLRHYAGDATTVQKLAAEAVMDAEAALIRAEGKAGKP